MSNLQAAAVPLALLETAQQPDLARRFGGVSRVYGEAGYARIRAAHIAVVGIGGVGSWTVEALARSGVGRLTLIDLDHIAESNTNRQIHALGDAYGKAKVLAMAERVAAINPECVLRPVEEFVEPGNVVQLLSPQQGYDWVIDCTDQVSAKAAILAHCRVHALQVVTCGAAGGRLDPTRLRVDDLARSQGDPLLSSLRQYLRKHHGFAPGTAAGSPLFHVSAVYSNEKVRLPGADALQCAPQAIEPSAGLACAGYGSAVVVTAPMGFAAAAVALQSLANAAVAG